MTDQRALPYVMGLTVDEAQALLLPCGITTLRAFIKDGSNLATADYRTDRYNVWVDETGVIVKINGVG